MAFLFFLYLQCKKMFFNKRISPMKIANAYNRLLTLFGVIAFFGCLAIQPAFAQFLESPRVGEVYEDFVIAPSGDQYRVTDPDAGAAGAQEFKPNPILNLNIDDLEGATRAEAIFNAWGGHVGTSQKAFSNFRAIAFDEGCNHLFGDLVWPFKAAAKFCLHFPHNFNYLTFHV